MTWRRRLACTIGAAATLAALAGVAPAGASAALGISGLTTTPSGTQAGSHPNFTMALRFSGDSTPKAMSIQLPPGFVGNPNAAAKCAQATFQAGACGADSVVGSTNVYVSVPVLGGGGGGGRRRRRRRWRRRRRRQPDLHAAADPVPDRLQPAHEGAPGVGKPVRDGKRRLSIPITAPGTVYNLEPGAGEPARLGIEVRPVAGTPIGAIRLQSPIAVRDGSRLRPDVDARQPAELVRRPRHADHRHGPDAERPTRAAARASSPCRPRAPRRPRASTSRPTRGAADAATRVLHAHRLRRRAVHAEPERRARDHPRRQHERVLDPARHPRRRRARPPGPRLRGSRRPAARHGAEPGHRGRPRDLLGRAVRPGLARRAVLPRRVGRRHDVVHVAARRHAHRHRLRGRAEARPDAAAVRRRPRPRPADQADRQRRPRPEHGPDHLDVLQPAAAAVHRLRAELPRRRTGDPRHAAGVRSRGQQRRADALQRQAAPRARRASSTSTGTARAPPVPTRCRSRRGSAPASIPRRPAPRRRR